MGRTEDLRVVKLFRGSTTDNFLFMIYYARKATMIPYEYFQVEIILSRNGPDVHLLGRRDGSHNILYPESKNFNMLRIQWSSITVKIVSFCCWSTGKFFIHDLKIPELSKTYLKFIKNDTNLRRFICQLIIKPP